MDGGMMNTLVYEELDADKKHFLANKWLQLACGVACMMCISSPQYVWTLFTKPIMAKFGVELPVLQITFSILIVLQTFFSPFQGWLVDRFGPRVLLSFGTVLTGLSWILSAQANDVESLYLTYGLLGGLGTGIVYIGIVGLIVKWFPDKRGFAVGMVAAGYGMGAVITTFPIAQSIQTKGYQDTLLNFGVIISVLGFLISQCLRTPPDMQERSNRLEESGVTPQQMLKTPIFWVMFVMMSMMSTSGLMVISQMGAFSKDFGVASVMVWGMAALPLALTIDRFTNGLTRPFFGYVSDRIGRENTMFIAFSLEAAAMLVWMHTITNPVLFVMLSGVVFFGWGEIFSLFPSTLTDTFGKKHATTNYGFLYMAQGIGSIFGGPIAAFIHHQYGDWNVVFWLMIGLDVCAATLALFVLKPMRKRV
jgi:oxalate/formate antiporter